MEEEIVSVCRLHSDDVRGGGGDVMREGVSAVPTTLQTPTPSIHRVVMVVVVVVVMMTATNTHSPDVRVVMELEKSEVTEPALLAALTWNW